MPMPLPGESASAARASSAAKMETSSSGKVVAKLDDRCADNKLRNAGGFRHPRCGIHKEIAALDDEHETHDEQQDCNCNFHLQIPLFLRFQSVFVFFFRKIMRRKALFLL